MGGGILDSAPAIQPSIAWSVSHHSTTQSACSSCCAQATHPALRFFVAQRFSSVQLLVFAKRNSGAKRVCARDIGTSKTTRLCMTMWKCEDSCRFGLYSNLSCFFFLILTECSYPGVVFCCRFLCLVQSFIEHCKQYLKNFLPDKLRA